MKNVNVKNIAENNKFQQTMEPFLLEKQNLEKKSL